MVSPVITIIAQKYIPVEVRSSFAHSRTPTVTTNVIALGTLLQRCPVRHWSTFINDIYTLVTRAKHAHPDIFQHSRQATPSSRCQKGGEGEGEEGCRKEGRFLLERSLVDTLIF